MVFSSSSSSSVAAGGNCACPQARHHRHQGSCGQHGQDKHWQSSLKGVRRIRRGETYSALGGSQAVCSQPRRRWEGWAAARQLRLQRDEGCGGNLGSDARSLGSKARWSWSSWSACGRCWRLLPLHDLRPCGATSSPEDFKR